MFTVLVERVASVPPKTVTSPLPSALAEAAISPPS